MHKFFLPKNWRKYLRKKFHNFFHTQKFLQIISQKFAQIFLTQKFAQIIEQKCVFFLALQIFEIQGKICGNEALLSASLNIDCFWEATINKFSFMKIS